MNSVLPGSRTEIPRQTAQLRAAALGLLTPAVLLIGECNRSPEKPVSAIAAVPVQTAVAELQDVPRRVESIGSVQALRAVTVKSQVDGIIALVNFKEGQDVKAGDLLVTLDRRPFENSLRSARADLATARAQSEQAQADLDRYQQLNERSAISKEEYVQYVTRAATTKAQVQAKEAAVANAELQLGYTEIRAPIAGRTGQRLLHEGALVKANDNNFSLVTVNQLSPIAVTYSVPEGALTEIRDALRSGAAAVSVVERNTGLKRENGELEFVDNTIDPTTGMVTLKATFPNDDQALWPGEFVFVTTKTGVDRGVVVVPATAVQNSQKGSTVYVLKPDQTADLREVKVTRTMQDNVLLADGVKAGETVVTDGQLRLLPGMKAQPRQPNGTPITATADTGDRPRS
jgi:multidrug efflux system membrane fusion protein